MGEALLPRHGHIGVMVSGYIGYPGWIAETLQPARGAGKFSIGRYIHQIAGEGHVIGACSLDVGNKGAGNGRIMLLVPLPFPVQRADKAFQGKIFPCGARRQRPKMDIREMSER